MLRGELQWCHEAIDNAVKETMRLAEALEFECEKPDIDDLALVIRELTDIVTEKHGWDDSSVDETEHDEEDMEE